tara:strand:- start:263 stop:433 length:171 start_codon:yes stop_codon:yes gene_type:complete
MKVICPHCKSYTPLRSDGLYRVHKYYKFDGDYKSGEWVICPLSGTPYEKPVCQEAT